MNYWFTSDTHFGHANIIEYCKRPFADTAEMDATMISRWNERVAKRDLVFHLGDFAFCRSGNSLYLENILQQLNGQIVFIKGNHDKLAWSFRNNFYAAHDSYHETVVNGQTIILCHYAIVGWKGKHRNTWHLCGHYHYNLAAARKEATCLGKILDVGVDGNNFYPYSFDEIAQIMEKKPKLNTIPELQDHHE